MSYSTWWARCVTAALLATTAVSTHALSLTEALALARHTDPQFLAAQANVSVTHERARQALGALLPQASLSLATTANQRSYLVLDSTLPPAADNYNSNSAQLNVTQHVWHRPNRIALTQAQAVEAQADHQLGVAEQDLRVRLVQAWFDVMLERDSVVFNAGQVVATRHQWEQASRAAAIGLASGPMLEEAGAKYEQALADQRAAETEQEIKLATLEQIIGPLALMTPPSLSDGFIAKDPRKLSLGQWLSQADSFNPAVLAAVRALDAANEEIRKQYAGHQPTLDVVATLSRNVQAVGSFPGQNGSDITQQAIALQLTIPLYSGGTQNAKAGEAIAMRDKVGYELEAAKRSARLTAKQAWFTWHAGEARQTAAHQTIKFTGLALQAAIRGKASGTKAELDVLQARQQWFGVVRDLQKARHDMITSYIKLQAAAGQLTDADVTSLEGWFVGTEAKTAQN